MGADYKPGEKRDLYIKNIQRVVLMLPGKQEMVPEAPCGNLVGLVGVDLYISKEATITNVENGYRMHKLKYSVSPVVRVSVHPKEPGDLPKLVEGLKRLSKSDPIV